jgi:segregation and condensation protein B
MSEKENPMVTLVQDPFGIKTLEIADAQRNSEEEADLNDSDLSTDSLDDQASEWEADADADTELESQSDSTEENLELAAEDGITDPLPDTLPDTLANALNADEHFENLARAIDEANAQQALEATEALANTETEQELAEQLAREIAEDQEIAKALAGNVTDEDEEQDEELLAAMPQSLDLDEMQSCIETLLFMTDKPMSVKKLQELLGPELPHSLFQEAVTALRDQYAHSRHGIEIVEIAGGLQFRTKPGRAALAKKLAKVQTQRLSSGAMETLAIIAYRQPAMKEDVDKIRGVDSSYFVRQLLDRKLIAISGRSDLPGRPMVYSTTDDFLGLFGLKDLTSMPSLRELEQMIPSSQSNNPNDEDPRIREMRRLVDEMKSDSSTSLIYNPEEDENILKEIREKVNSIPTSTPYLEEQKALEKQAKELLAAQAAQAQAQVQQGSLGLTDGTPNV